MLCILDTLEPRFLEPHGYLAQEREPAIELFFITSGHIDVGYQNNYKKQKSRLIRLSNQQQFVRHGVRLRQGSIIGIEMLFDLRSKFYYRASMQNDCFCIRKINWRRIILHKFNDLDMQETYNKLVHVFKKKQLYQFMTNVYLPI